MKGNVIIAGVGGQGLVLATRVIGEVALRTGLDVKTCDVIGLAQRGGMVWGSVRFAPKVYAPLIPAGEADYLLALEQLEGLRWRHLLKPQANVIMSRQTTFPNRVLLEKEPYPENIPVGLRDLGYKVVEVDAEGLAANLGNTRLANTIMLGTLARFLDFPTPLWLEVLRLNVPERTREPNAAAFKLGFDQGQTN